MSGVKIPKGFVVVWHHIQTGVAVPKSNFKNKQEVLEFCQRDPSVPKYDTLIMYVSPGVVVEIGDTDEQWQKVCSKYLPIIV